MKNSSIKGVIFDLDNTLLDFMQMKEFAVKAAIKGMIEAGLLMKNLVGKIKRFLMFLLKDKLDM